MIRIALYKRRRGVFNHLIYYWQFLTNARAYRKYTHVEVIVDGVWYTASYTKDGIRKRTIKGNPDHWDFIEIKATKLQKEKIAGWYESRIGSGYDWCGIVLSQVLPLNIGHPKKWFCSESIYASLVSARIIPRHRHAQWYSPARLTQYLKPFGS